jgi:hypothetical protein
MADEVSVQRILGTICDRAGCFAGKDQGAAQISRIELRVCEEFEGETEREKELIAERRSCAVVHEANSSLAR